LITSEVPKIPSKQSMTRSFNINLNKYLTHFYSNIVL